MLILAAFVSTGPVAQHRGEPRYGQRVFDPFGHSLADARAPRVQGAGLADRVTLCSAERPFPRLTIAGQWREDDFISHDVTGPLLP
jgi:hypothetical protein